MTIYQLVGIRHAVSANAKDDIVDVSDTACPYLEEQSLRTLETCPLKRESEPHPTFLP